MFMIRCEPAFHNGLAKDGIVRTIKQMAPFLESRTVINRTTDRTDAMKMQTAKNETEHEWLFPRKNIGQTEAQRLVRDSIF